MKTMKSTPFVPHFTTLWEMVFSMLHVSCNYIVAVIVRLKMIGNYAGIFCITEVWLLSMIDSCNSIAIPR